MAEEPKRNWWKIGCLGLIGFVVLISVLGALVGEPESEKAAIASANGSSEEDGAAAMTEVEQDEAPSLTGPQRNAVRSAEAYLQMTGFSRKGLIEQLSSDAGNGYDRADATVAVDSLNVDWNEQAARSARQYLDMMGFSCKGLIEQLSSSAGSDYTTEEATYGAQQAGAC
tara:strand:- start:1108 stop:1617 length:510 start_codon:yes stop_codon:yes gene_type:complete